MPTPHFTGTVSTLCLLFRQPIAAIHPPTTTPGPSPPSPPQPSTPTPFAPSPPFQPNPPPHYPTPHTHTSTPRALPDLLQRAYLGASTPEVYMEDSYFNGTGCVSAEFGPGKLGMPDASMGIPVGWNWGWGWGAGVGVGRWGVNGGYKWLGD